MARRRRPWIRRLAIIVASMTGLVLVAFAALAIRVTRGPVALNFLEPRLNEALKGDADNPSVEVRHPVMVWGGWRRPLDLRAGPVRLIGPDGTVTIEVEEASVGLSLARLVRGGIAPTRIEISRLSIHVVRAQDGTVSVGFTTAKKTPSSEPAAPDMDPRQMFNRLMQPPGGTGPVGLLTDIAVTDAVLSYEDRVLGREWRASRADLEARRDASGGTIRFDLEVEQPTEPATLQLMIEFDQSTRVMTVDIHIDKLNPAHSADGIPGLEFTSAFDFPVKASARCELTSELEISACKLSLDSDLGQFEAEATQVASGGLGIKVDLEGLRLAGLESLVHELGSQDLTIDGKASVILSSDWRPGDLSLELNAARGSVVIPGVFEQPIAVEGVALKGNFSGDQRSATIERLEVALDGLTLTAKASAERGEQTTELNADIRLSDFDAARIDEYWPSKLVPDVLDWISTNITAGKVQSSEVHLGLAAPADLPGPVRLAELRGSFLFDDLQVAYFAPMPSAEGVTGSASFDVDGFDFKVTAGRIRDLVVDSATVGIGPLSGHTRLRVDAHGVRGPMRTALEAIVGPPLDLIGATLPQPECFSGSAVTHLVLDVPLSGGDPEPLAATGSSRLKTVGLEGWPTGYSITRGDLDLGFDMTHLDLEGEASINGAPVSFTWREPLDGNSPPRTVTAKATLDEEDRVAIGVPAISQIQGPVDVDLTITGRADGSMETEFAVDLTPTTLSVQRMGWKKPAGDSGTLTAGAVISPDWAVDVRRFEIEAGDLRAVGSLSTTPGFAGLRRLAVDRLAFGDNRISASIEVSDDGVLDVEIRGDSLDVGHLFAPVDPGPVKGEPRSALPDLTIDLRLDNVVSGPTHRWGSLRGTAAIENSALVRLDATLLVTPENPFVVQLLPSPTGGHDVHITAVDAGEVVGALLPGTEIQGGALDVSGRREAPDQPIKVHATLHDFKIAESTMLTRILQIASIGDALKGLAGSGLHFSRLESDLEWLGNTIDIIGFRSYGESIGLTADGPVDLEKGTAEIKGVVIPASRFQQFLGKVPILGTLLTGTKKEGLVAVEYQVSGELADPEISAKPLSILTPGILRDLFRIPKDETRPEE